MSIKFFVIFSCSHAPNEAFAQLDTTNTPPLEGWTRSGRGGSYQFLITYGEVNIRLLLQPN